MSALTPFVLNEQQLSRHMAVFGGSGSGKSKFLELLCRRMMDDYRGFCFIDPHGDTVEDLLAYAAKRVENLRTDAVCKRIHYLEPTFETVFGFDPFEFRAGANIPEHLRSNAYHAWLHAKADKVAEIVQRKQGQSDFQGMARLQRILRDVLIAVGTPIMPDGRHLPLSDVLVLLDSHHPRHADVLKLVVEHLPSEVRADFASLRSYRSEEQRKKETESTINRLRSLLSPIVKAIFSSTAATINFSEIIKNRGIVLVNLRKTDFFSADQRNAIGGLLIHEILSTAETTARQDRTPYYLIVDEARLFVGEDMMEALDQARKFKLSVCLAGQYLGQFRTDEYDMTPSILNNCGTILCFQQKHPEDLDTWKKFFGYANLNFEKHFQIVDRQKGYDYLDVDDWSETHAEGWNASTSTSENVSIGASHSRNEGKAYQRSSGVTRSQEQGVSRSHSNAETSSDSESVGSQESQSVGSQESHGSSEHRSEGSSVSESDSYTRSRSDGRSRSTPHGDRGTVSHTEGMSHTHGEGRSFQESHGSSTQETHGTSTQSTHGTSTQSTHGTSSQESFGTSVSQSTGRSDSRGKSVTSSFGTTDGVNASIGFGSSESQGVSGSDGKTINHKKIPVPHLEEELQETPHLRDSVQDQLDRFAKLQRTLKQRCAMVSMADRQESFIIRVADVDSVYPVPNELQQKLSSLKQKIYALHPYYSTPNLSPEEQDRRLDEFLRAASAQPESGGQKEPEPEENSGFAS